MKNLLEKVKGILFDPANSWQKVKEEKIDIKQFLFSYVLILAAIGPVSQFIGYVIIGRAFGFRLSFFGGLFNLILSYVVSIAGIALASFIMGQLSLSLNYKKDFIEHFKLISYSLTPYWILSVFYIIPPISAIAIIGGLYSLYLLYLGTPIVIEVPKEKIIIYIIILVIILFIIYFCLNLLSSGAFLLGLRKG
jgi:hypothetical protein